LSERRQISYNRGIMGDNRWPRIQLRGPYKLRGGHSFAALFPCLLVDDLPGRWMEVDAQTGEISRNVGGPHFPLFFWCIDDGLTDVWNI
jgi:hypothetical protein